MALKIITADERLAAPQHINQAIFGPSGVGKTTLARTLDPETTLFVDLEAGMLAVGDWKGSHIDVIEQAKAMGCHPWDLCKALAVWIGGPDPAADPNHPEQAPYAEPAYNSYCAALGDPAMVAGKNKLFWDSITVAGRMSFGWSMRQPQSFSEKTGKPDMRGTYGLHGREMIRWLTHIQHIKNRSTIVVGILDEEKDDLGRITYWPQIDGSKTGREIGGIFDQVLTLASLTAEDGTKFRALVTHQDNPWGYPAKDRSGKLDMLEPPDLGALFAKMQSGPRVDGTLATALGTAKAA